MTGHGSRSPGWYRLKRTIIAITVLQAPVFLAVMFLTVTHLLRPSFGWWAWTVPVATEICFVVAYLLDILLEWAGKPMGWLRFVPWLFAASSLLLNVWAYLGDVPGMVGHAVVTVAFFLPLIAGEAAVRSLSASEEEVALSRAMGDARRYAIDLLRAELGWQWRLRAPRLMRRQVVTGRLPHAVTAAVKDSLAAYAEPWEPVLERWVVEALTKGVKVAAEVRREKHVIETTVIAPQPAIEAAATALQTAGSAPASTRAAKHAHVRQLLSDGTSRTRKQIASLAGVSVPTVDRIKRDMPTPIRSRQAAGS